MRFRLLPTCLSIVLLSTTVVVGTSVGTAHATSPGENGRIFYTDDVDGDETIYSVNPDGSDPRQLAEGTDPAVDATGSRVAYFSGPEDRDVSITSADGRFTYIVAIPDDSAGDGAYPTALAWSREGASLLLALTRNKLTAQGYEEGLIEIERVSLTGNHADYPLALTQSGPLPSEVTPVTDRDQVCDLESSPVSYAFLFSDVCNSIPASPSARLSVFGDADTDMPLSTPLLDPDFSPDGTKIIGEYGAQDNNLGSIYEVNDDGSDPTFVAYPVSPAGAAYRSQAEGPVFSPDGKYIAYGQEDFLPAESATDTYAYSAQQGGVHVMPAAPGGKAVDIASDGYGPVWAPAPKPDTITCREGATQVIDTNGDGIVKHLELPAPCSSSNGAPLFYQVIDNHAAGGDPLTADGYQPAWDSSTLGYLSFNDPTPNGRYGPAQTAQPVPADLTYRVSDAAGNSATGSYDVQVNLHPVCSPTNGGTVTTPATIRIACSDPEGQQLRYTVLRPPSQGTVRSIPGSDRVIYTPNPGATGSDSFEMTASDGTNTSSSFVTVSVDGAPTCAYGQTLPSVMVSGSLTTGVNCQDPNGDPLTYEALPPTPAGSLQVSAADGQLTMTANPSFHGNASVPVRVSDGGTTVIETQPVVVNGPPACQPVTVSTSGPVTLTLNCTDPEGDSITGYQFQGESATATSVANQFVFTPPDPNENETYTFTYTASDKGSSGAPATITVHALAPPHCDEALASTNAGTAVTIPLTCDLATGDNGPLTLQAGSVAPSDGTVGMFDSADQNVIYTPTAGFNGVDTFTYDATDANGTSKEQRVTVDVGNLTPQCTDTGTTTTANQLNVQLTCDAEGGPALTYKLLTQPTLGTATVDATSGVVSYTRGTDKFGYLNTGVDTFTYQASNEDGTSQTATASVTLSGLPPTCSPTATHDTVFQGDGGVAVEDTCRSSYDATETRVIVTPPSFGTLVNNQVTGGVPTVTYIPVPGFIGTDSYTYRYHDQWGDSPTVTETLTVKAARPVCQAGSLSTTQGAPIVLTANCSSSTGVAPTESFSPYYTVPQGCSCTVASTYNANTLTFTPPAGALGVYKFKIGATDGDGGSTGGIGAPFLSVSVLPPAPSCSDQYATVQAGAPQQVTLSCNDPAAASQAAASPAAASPAATHAAKKAGVSPDSASPAVTGVPADPDLAYGINTPPTAGTLSHLDPVNGTIMVDPDADASGTDSVTYDAASVGGLSTPATIHLTVTAPAPACSDVSTSGVDSAAVPVRLNCLVGSSSPLRYAVVSQPPHGTLSVPDADGSLSYTPSPGWDGTDTFTYMATADGVESAPATVTVHVAAPPPTCSSGPVSTTAGTAAHVVLSCTDSVKNQQVTYAVVFISGNGTVTGLDPASGAFDFTPAAGFTGMETLTYTGETTDGRSATGYLTINVAPPASVTPTPSPPVVVPPVVVPPATGASDLPPVLLTPAMPQPVPSLHVTGLRLIGSLHVSHGSAQLQYRLNTATRVRETFYIVTMGRKVGGRCVATTKKNGRAKPCMLETSITVKQESGRSGLNTQKLTANLVGHRLKPGRYEVDLLVTLTGGRSVTLGKLTFTVLR